MGLLLPFVKPVYTAVTEAQNRMRFFFLLGVIISFYLFIHFRHLVLHLCQHALLRS